MNSFEDFTGHLVANKPKPAGPWLAFTYDMEKFGIKPNVVDMMVDTDRVSALLAGQVEIISGTSFVESVLRQPGQAGPCVHGQQIHP